MKRIFNPDHAQNRTNKIVEEKFFSDAIEVVDRYPDLQKESEDMIQNILWNLEISPDITKEGIEEVFNRRVDEYLHDMIKNALELGNKKLYNEYISLPGSADILNRRYRKIFVKKHLKQASRPKLSKVFLMKVTEGVEKRIKETEKNDLRHKYGIIVDEFISYIKQDPSWELYTKVLDFITMAQKKTSIPIEADDEDRFQRLAVSLKEEKNKEDEESFSLRFIHEIKELTAFLQSKRYKTFTSSKTEAIKELLDVIRGRWVVISPEDEKRFYATARKIIKEKKL